MVCNADSTVMLDANIVLLHSDSIIAQNINSEHGFKMENVPNGTYSLNISHVGYQSRQIDLDVKTDLDLGTILLPFGYELDEVVIKSARNIVSYKNNLLHVAVKQTYLSELPNMETLLNNIPGIILTDNKLTYFGKGQPLILIDGKEIKTMEELNPLQPSQIQEIIVDNMPGAKYDSRYSAVINIKTSLKKPALMIYHTDIWARHYSAIAGVTSQIKAKSTLIDFAYGIRKRNNTLYSEQIEESFQRHNLFERTFSDTTYSDRMSHDWHVGTQNKFKNGTMNLRYEGYYATNAPVYNSTMHNLSSMGQEMFDILQTGKYKERQHLVSLDYMLELTKENSIRVTTDYLNQYRKDNNTTVENSLSSEKQTDLDFQGRYHIYSLLAEYEHTFSKSAKLSTGARYSYVHNNNDSKENDISTSYCLQENRYALYAEGHLQWRKIAIQLGLRAEIFDKKYRYTGQRDMGYKDIFFLPSFSFTYPQSETFQISISGNNKVFLPSFNELTPITTYLNQYSYIIGNPLLKPTVRYDFSMMATLQNKFSLELGYAFVKNDRTAFCTPDEKSAQVLKSSYTNIDHTRQLTGMLTYSEHLWQRHSINLSTGVLIPDVKIPYMDKYLHRTTPTCFAQLFSNWKIGQIINLSVSYVFQSKSYDRADTYSATHDLGCSISVIPIKNKLTINVQVNDILQKANGNWGTNYGYIRTKQCDNPDSRNITLSIRYTFNSFKHMRQNVSNGEEMDRL